MKGMAWISSMFALTLIHCFGELLHCHTRNDLAFLPVEAVQQRVAYIQ